MPTRYPIVARQGWFYLAVPLAAGVFIGSTVNWVLALPEFVLALYVAYLFRDPRREVPSSPLAVICPVDGKLISIGPCKDPFLQREAQCIEIKTSRLGSYVVRSPTEGNIVERWYRHEGIEDGIDQFAVWVRTDEDDDIVVAMLRTSGWQGLECHIQAGERVGQGQRCGFLRFGARVQVFVPANARLEVEPGQRLKSGKDIVATLVHRPAET
jgi:phosphatidylserine decarboxylase